jgi:hypothetical protein
MLARNAAPQPCRQQTPRFATQRIRRPSTNPGGRLREGLSRQSALASTMRIDDVEEHAVGAVQVGRLVNCGDPNVT